jgi:hypothetical protein
VDTLLTTMMNPECLRYFEVEYMKYAGSSPSPNTVSFQDFVAVSLERIANFAGSSKEEEWSNTTGTSSSSSSAMSGENDVVPPSPDSTFDFSIQNWQRKVEARPAVFVGSPSCEVTANFYETKSDHQLMLMEYDDGSCHHQLMEEEENSISSMWSADSDDELQNNYFVNESSFADCGEVEEYSALEDNENLRQFIYCC